jgi:hypothetical protein
MYGYHDDISSIDEFFSRINQEEVFKHVFGNFEVGTYIKSPFRNDDSPGCWIQWYKGKLYFTDFANSGKANLDVIGIIQEYYSLTFKDAMTYILETDLYQGESEFEKYKSDSIVSTTSNTLEFCPKPFDNYHKQFWSQYEITSSQLIEDNIFATKWYKVNGNVFTPYPQETTYTISFKEQGIKICRPKAKEYKWLTNTTKNTIGGTSNLPFMGDTLFISKSYKDWRVLTNLGKDAIYFQNEGMFPNMETLNIYLNMFTNVIVLFDNDEPGIIASNKLVEYINGHYKDKAMNIVLPFEEKDPADIIKAGKKQELINFLK